MPRGIPKAKTVIESPNGAVVHGVLSAESVEGSGLPPAKQTTDAAAPPKKKGKRSWGRSNVLGVVKKEDGFTYRWVAKEAMNVAKKLEQGWEYCSSIVNSKALHTPTERVYDGGDLTSTKETRDSILMRLPDELKAERDEWLNGENQRSKDILERDLKSQSGMKGSVQFEGGGYKNIIE